MPSTIPGQPTGQDTGQDPSETTRTPGPQHELDVLLNRAAVVSLTQTGWIEVTGSDRVRWLNGMVTNSVQDLAPGQGCYNFILNAQGRIQGDACIFAEPEHLVLETSASQLPNLLSILDRFIIMDDVELTGISTARIGLLLAGPRAPSLLRDLNLLPAGSAPSLAHLPWRDASLTVIHAYSSLVPRFEIWSEQQSAIAGVSAELANLGAAPCTPQALELLRILEGTPLFGKDIRDRDLPQETGASRALHFSKGCYLGQEIVERIRSRGSVHRTFHGFHLQGGNPSPGLALSVDGKPVGELTSVAVLPPTPGTNQSVVGLGYIRREALASGKPIQYEGGGAQPASLPFSRSDNPLIVTDI